MTTKRTRDRERGSILIMSVVGIVVAMISAALAVDLGRLASDKRDDQKIADLAALDASRDLDHACQRANHSAQRNGLPPNSLSCVQTDIGNPAYDVVRGTYSAGVFTPNATGDAVQVTVRSSFDPTFPFVVGPDSTKGVAVAGSSSEAAFSVGSTLASLDANESVLDPVLGGMLGLTTAQISGVSYDGLAGANVSLNALQTELAGLGYTVGTPDQLLTTEVTVVDLLKATASALDAQGDYTAKAEVDKLVAASISSLLKVKLGDLVDLNQPGSSSALDTTLNVFNLVRGAASVANGNNFVSTGISVNVPVVGSVGTSLRVIERAQTAHGPVGTTAHNSQVVLRLAIPVAVVGTSVNVEVTAADVEAELTEIACSTTPPRITLGVDTDAAAIGGFTSVGGFLGGTLTLSGNLAAGASVPDQEFDYTDEFSPPVGTASPRQVGASSLSLTPASLNVAGTGAFALQAGTVDLVLTAALTAIGPLLVSTLQPALRALGLEIGAADLSALDIFPAPPACGQPRLLS